MYLPLELDVLKSLTNEFEKISMDAGARATLAGKTGRGQTYLPGGELPSNDPTQTNFLPKIAQDDLREKARDLYIRARGPTSSALKGATAGAVLGNVLTGGRLGMRTGLTRFGLRASAATGAGIGLADYFAHGGHIDDASKIQGRIARRKAVIPSEKIANFLSSTFTPARQLSEGLHTGSFEKIIHKGGHLKPATVGRRFTQTP